MRHAFIDRQAFRYKLAYDGIDLIAKPLTRSIIGLYGQKHVQKHCKLSFSFQQSEDFIKSCITSRKQSKNIDFRGLSSKILDKYEVGLFTVSEQNCFENAYVLFNKEQLNFWKSAGVSIFNAQFMVIPSRDWEGKINEIGFRILNPQIVQNSFKWLFPIGQQATFGLHKCSKGQQLVLCEGFLDYVAFNESGYKNIVGLGSIEITPNHMEQLKTANWVVCFDMDGYGLIKSSKFIDQNRACFYSPEGKDPYAVYQKHGKVDLVFIE